METVAVEKYGRWTVISPLKKGPAKAYRLSCRCECGTVRDVLAYTLRNGTSQSCGCLNREAVSDFCKRTKTTHGCAQSGKKTKTYNVWAGMRKRCMNRKHSDFPLYGGRGISICERWKGVNGFANFLADMGEVPVGMSLDRIDNNGDYCPENCRWADQKTQQRNRRSNRAVTIDGRTLIVTDWAKEFNIKVHTVWSRIRKGWDVHLALTTPCKKRGG